jgi:hypothetical protein
MEMLGMVLRRLVRRHEPIRCFEHDLRAAGPLLGRADVGLHVVAVEQIVGSVGRWQHLRADFLDRADPRLTTRHHRIAAAMDAGRPLPALHLYRLRGARRGADTYYVVDGHHRVAMARRLGQVYLDAHIIEFRVGL